MATLGLDIGGANLKAATEEGTARSRPFDLWRTPELLSKALRELIAEFPAVDRIAVTMTGELADCFTTKAEGVAQIVRSAVQAAGQTRLNIWSLRSGFVSPNEAIASPFDVAAANWHALTTWAGRLIPEGSGVLIDIGSTTCDIIPLSDGVPVPTGLTDVGRLVSGELVYSGVRRTPLSALANSVPFRELTCPLAAELFATTLDVYLLLGRIAEDPDDRQTANGRPATRAAAADRLARMLCCDRTEISDSELQTIAEFLGEVQRKRIRGALDRVLARMGTPVQSIVVSGSGSFLAEEIVASHRQLKDCFQIPLARLLSPQIADSACAYAIAVQAAERN